MWVPAQEMRYSATSSCFQAGPSLRFAGGKEVYSGPGFRPIESVGGKQRAKMLHYNLPLLSAQLSGRAHHAQIHTVDAGQFYIYMQACQARSLGLCAGIGVQCESLAFRFSDLPFHPPHQFSLQAYHQKGINPPNYPKVCSGRETVWWLQSYALRTLFGHLCRLRKG